MRFPCGGCGRKKPVEELKLVKHDMGAGGWFMDKQCAVCRGEK